MITPLFGLLFQLFSTPRSDLESFAACGIILGAIFYISRIVRTCIASGFEVDRERQAAELQFDQTQPEKPSNEPYCAG